MKCTSAVETERLCEIGLYRHLYDKQMNHIIFVSKYYFYELILEHCIVVFKR